MMKIFHHPEGCVSKRASTERGNRCCGTPYSAKRNKIWTLASRSQLPQGKFICRQILRHASSGLSSLYCPFMLRPHRSIRNRLLPPPDSHDAPSEELCHRPKLVAAPLQRILEQVMSFRRLLLRVADGSNRSILLPTNRTLAVPVRPRAAHLVEAALVEGVFAQIMDRREIETATA